MSGLYCVGCEEFKTEDELVDGKCPIHVTVPERIEEANYFFRLSAYQDKLLELYDVAAGVRPARTSASTRRGASSPAVSRTSRSAAPASRGGSHCRGTRARSPTSGPTRSSTTSARSPTPGPGEDLIPDVFWPEVRHVMAKDILRFHCVYWPAMLARRPGTRCRSRSSSTATCCSTTGRSRSRRATSSIRSS